MTDTGRFIEDLTWPEVATAFNADVPVIIPIGAASKEHGHHLPMKTDWLLARALMPCCAAMVTGWKNSAINTDRKRGPFMPS